MLHDLAEIFIEFVHDNVVQIIVLIIAALNQFCEAYMHDQSKSINNSDEGRKEERMHSNPANYIFKLCLNPYQSHR